MRDRIKSKLRWEKDSRKYIGVQGKNQRNKPKENVQKEKPKKRFNVLGVIGNFSKRIKEKLKLNKKKKLSFSKEKFPEMQKKSIKFGSVKSLFKSGKKKSDKLENSKAEKGKAAADVMGAAEAGAIETVAIDAGAAATLDAMETATEADSAADSADSAEKKSKEDKALLAKELGLQTPEQEQEEKRAEKERKKEEKKAKKKENKAKRKEAGKKKKAEKKVKNKAKRAKKKAKAKVKKQAKKEKRAAKREKRKAWWKAKTLSTKICIILTVLIILTCAGLAGYMFLPSLIQSIPQKIEDFKNRPDPKDQEILEEVEKTTEKIESRRELFQNYSMAGDSNSAISGAKYVSAEGRADGNGSEAAPFGSIQQGINALQKGEILYVKGGTYRENLLISKEGAAGAYITITSSPGEKVILESSDPKSDTPIVTFRNSKYVTFTNIEIQNGSKAASFENSKNIIMAGNLIHDINAATGETRVIEIENDKNLSPTRAIFIYYNKIQNCDTKGGAAIHVSGNAEYINLMGNIIENIKGPGIYYAGSEDNTAAASINYPRNSSISGNTVKLCRASGITAGIIMDTAKDISIEDNVVYRSDKGIEVRNSKAGNTFESNILIKNNLLACNYEGAIFIGSNSQNSVTNVSVQNVTTVNSYIEDSQSDITIENAKKINISDNIFYNEKANGMPIAIKHGEDISFPINIECNMYKTMATEETIPFMYYAQLTEGLSQWKNVSGDSKSIYYHGDLEGICQRASLGDYSYMHEDHLIGCRIMQAAE